MTPPGTPFPSSDPRLEQARNACRNRNLPGAVPLYQAYLGAHPDSREAHRELGQVLARLGRARDSIVHLRRAASLDPNDADTMIWLASQLSALREFTDALEVYNALRALRPQDPEFHADAASLYEILGDFDQARAAIDAGLGAAPAHPRCTALLIKLDLRRTQSDQDGPDEPTLRAWLTQLEQIASAANPFLKGMALELVADIHEKLADDPAAFATFQRINDADRDARRRTMPNQQARDAYLRSIDMMGAAINPALGARWGAQPPRDGLPAPAFLVGFPRSGTTMTERALGAHPMIRSIEERPTLEACKGQVPRMVGTQAFQTRPLAQILDALSPAQITELRAFYWEQVRREIGPVPDDTLVLDKNPLRIIDLPLVNRIFPESRVVMALRDPRDVCLSCYRQRFNITQSPAMSLFLDLDTTALLYAKVMGLWLRTREAYTFPWKEIRYEDTVTNFEARIREVIDFLGAPWDDAVLSFHQTSGRRLTTTPSYHAVRQRVYTSAIGRWTRYADQLAPILPTLQPFVDAFGYT